MRNSRLILRILGLTIFVLSLTGCNGGTTSPATSSILEGTAWVLISLNGESLIEDTSITLNFEKTRFDFLSSHNFTSLDMLSSNVIIIGGKVKMNVALIVASITKRSL